MRFASRSWAALVFLGGLGLFFGRPNLGRSDEPLAAAAYARIEHDFGFVPRSETLAALEAFATEYRGSPAAARARVWRGQLALLDDDTDTATRFFGEALGDHPDDAQRRFALRGLGDAGLKSARLNIADLNYLAALDGADAVLASELTAKRRLVAKWQERRWVGFVSALLLAAAAAWFARRVLRGRGRLRFPSEATYAAPIFALLVSGARTSDRRVIPALAMCGVGAFLLIILSGLAADRDPAKSRSRIALHAAVLVAGCAGLFYLAAFVGDIMDLLTDTFAGSVK